MKKHLKKSIALTIVPAFVFVAIGCEDASNETQRLAVPNTTAQEVVQVNEDGSYSNTQAQNSSGQQLLTAFEEAKASGYTGTLEDFVKLTDLYQTNPEQAQQVAQDSGFDGGDLLLGALAGAAIGAIAAGAMNSRTGLANSTYSAQRANNANNYAYSQPQKKEERNSGSGTGSAMGGSSGGATAAATARSGSNMGLQRPTQNTSQTNQVRSTSTNTVRSAPSPKASYSSVSRGGFGGAVSSGG